MAPIILNGSGALVGAPLRLDYGVGLRIFSDRSLLRQIRDAVVRNAMPLEAIARLENVTTETLATLLDDELLPVRALREYAAQRPGYSVASWRTTRKHASKLHVCDPDGVPLCGTTPGAVPIAVSDGPCQTCAEHAGLVGTVQPAGAKR